MDYFWQYHREPRTTTEREALYGRVRKMAYWLDRFATVGGVNVGLDALVGFIPVIGDFMGLFASLYQVFLCSLFGIPIHLILRMLINVLIDFVIGLLPWVGDFLDIFYKSNQYNLTLFANWLEENQLVDVAKYDYDHPLSNDYRRSGRYRTRGSTAAAGSFGTSAHSSR